MKRLLRFLTISLILKSTIAIGDSYLICDWSKVNQNEHIEYFHFHKLKEKNGMKYYSKATLFVYPNMDEIKLNFKTKCGFFDEFCAIATPESYQYLLAYNLNRKSLILTSRLLAGGELPKSTQCESVSREIWLMKKNPKSTEKNQI